MGKEVKLMVVVGGWSCFVDIAVKSSRIFFPSSFRRQQLGDFEGSLKTVSNHTVEIKDKKGVVVVHDYPSLD